ncbi:hypothetical protein [Pedobacter sp. KACC 23697]|uniref:Glycosyltransferase family 25 protein n=1 Tax=Pedobacter sp. KACC 23697 TaxID=3149230 RepID=A0AAU7K908_9SPHI
MLEIEFQQMDTYISTFIINLENRNERLKNVLKEFEGKNEFKINVVNAVKHKIGAVGLFKSIQLAITIAKENNEDVIIICEDDHVFTEHYSKELLFKNIIEAHAQGVEILCGGISGGFQIAVPVSKNRIWLDNYYCNQFIVIFKSIYNLILNTEFDETKKVDQTLSALTMNKMTIFPFISIQKYFGYSDVSSHNQDDPEWARNRFEIASKNLRKVWQVYNFYQS